MDDFEESVIESIHHVAINNPVYKAEGVKVPSGRIGKRLDYEHGYSVEGDTHLWEMLSDVLDKYKNRLWFYRGGNDQHDLPASLYISEENISRIKNKIRE